MAGPGPGPGPGPCAQRPVLRDNEEISSHVGRHLLVNSYKKSDVVPLWASKVGPFSNPSETYEYTSLPFCQTPEGTKWKTLHLGEVVDANRMASTGYLLSFKDDKTNVDACTAALGSAEVAKFRKAVKENCS
eukprot:gene25390-11054_t